MLCLEMLPAVGLKPTYTPADRSLLLLVGANCQVPSANAPVTDAGTSIMRRIHAFVHFNPSPDQPSGTRDSRIVPQNDVKEDPGYWEWIAPRSTPALDWAWSRRVDL
ncbi:hypothetical protein V2G26_016123 [Clonostachys chloroleuca]